MKKLNTQEYIKKALSVHGEKYDYEKTIYVNSRNKTIVNCKYHGDFLILANSHLQGSGCAKCSDIKKGISHTNNISIKKNIISQPDDYKLIYLSKGKFAKVDNEDFEKISKINWCLKNGYACNNKLGMMHRIINDTPFNLFTDHINGDRLDNRRSNLRSCTQSENMANVKPIKNKTSKFKGVSYDSKRNKWVSQIGKENKTIFIGYFEREDEAAEAYNDMAERIYGDFSVLNNI